MDETARWQDGGQRWEGVDLELELELQLQQWSRKRRVLVLQRRLRDATQAKPDARQPELPGLVTEHNGGQCYEHAVLVANWNQPGRLAIAKVYRDRGDAENTLD